MSGAKHIAAVGADVMGFAPLNPSYEVLGLNELNTRLPAKAEAGMTMILRLDQAEAAFDAVEAVADAMSDCELLRIDRPNFLALVADNPTFALKLMRVCSAACGR